MELAVHHRGHDTKRKEMDELHPHSMSACRRCLPSVQAYTSTQKPRMVECPMPPSSLFSMVSKLSNWGEGANGSAMTSSCDPRTTTAPVPLPPNQPSQRRKQREKSPSQTSPALVTAVAAGEKGTNTEASWSVWRGWWMRQSRRRGSWSRRKRWRKATRRKGLQTREERTRSAPVGSRRKTSRGRSLVSVVTMMVDKPFPSSSPPPLHRLHPNVDAGDMLFLSSSLRLTTRH
uniref:Uncharacterized protein n=1 Tax=Oryza glumipatula TaxID=40148 RepID=A0A0D9YTD3_9ORYZ